MSTKFLNKYGNVRESYLTLKSLPHSKAIDYLEAVLAIFERFDLEKYVYFMSSDGAYNVSSQKNGLAGLLKKKIPHL